MSPRESSAAANAYYYPNRMGRVLLQSTEDVIGRSGLLAVLTAVDRLHYSKGFPPSNLDKKFPFDDVSMLAAGIDQIYGPRGGRMVGLRVGRVAMRYGLYEFGQVLGISDLTARLLPWSIKLTQGAEALMGLFNQFSDQIVRYEDTPDTLLWHVERCPVCWGRDLDQPRDFFTTGLLQESLLWLSGGKTFAVEQTACRAVGDARCTFEIDKTPLT